MVKIVSLIILFSVFEAGTIREDGWELFAKVKFTPQKIGNDEYLVPFFDSRIKEWEGKEMVLQGFYIPMDLVDKQTIIVSKVPNSSCFFCGAAGPETVVEVQLQKKPGKMKTDQVVEVKGKLKLNDHDVNHMNFILESAEINVLK
jgi:hypothetical protein